MTPGENILFQKLMLRRRQCGEKENCYETAPIQEE